jgi:hypothetical protein
MEQGGPIRLGCVAVHVLLGAVTLLVRKTTLNGARGSHKVRVFRIIVGCGDLLVRKTSLNRDTHLLFYGCVLKKRKVAQ